MKRWKLLVLLFAGLFLGLSGFAVSRVSQNKKTNGVQKQSSTSSVASPSAVLGEKENSNAASQTASSSWTRGAVSKVIDGDTVDVLIDGKRETIRLIGINTPESVDPRRPVECFGEQASQKAKEILNGQTVLLEQDDSQGQRDKYNRLLRYIFLEDGTNFNKLMIQEGYAYEYTYRDPYKYQEAFKEAERLAQVEKKGLWADDACVSPPQASNVTPTSAKTEDSYTCDCAKSCTQITVCEEAYYQLQECGCSERDSDGDGVPCESLCR